MLPSLGGKLPVSDSAQLLVHQWKEAVERAGIARAQLEQNIGDGLGIVIARHLAPRCDRCSIDGRDMVRNLTTARVARTRYLDS
jgi:hypothetical protein